MGLDTSNLAAKPDLASLKSEVHQIDREKIKTVCVDASKISNVFENGVTKKTVHDKLITKVNAIDTSKFVLKTPYSIDKSGLEKKIDNTDKKILIPVDLLEKQVITLKLLRFKVKYLILLLLMLLRIRYAKLVI